MVSPKNAKPAATTRHHTRRATSSRRGRRGGSVSRIGTRSKGSVDQLTQAGMEETRDDQERDMSRSVSPEPERRTMALEDQDILEASVESEAEVSELEEPSQGRVNDEVIPEQVKVSNDEVLRFQPDPKLEEKPRKKILPSLEKLMGLVDKLAIPTINLSEEPTAVEVLLFLQKMEAFRDDDGNIPTPILERAFLGGEEQEWCETIAEYEKIKNKMLNHVFRTDGWIDTCAKLKKGVRLDQNVREHIRRFKLVALYMNMRAEDDETKRIFVQSIGPSFLPLAIQEGGCYKTFQEIERLARLHEASLNHATRARSEEDDTANGTVATVATKKPRLKENTLEKQDERSEEQKPEKRVVKCFKCGKLGHYARDCPNKKAKQEQARRFAPWLKNYNTYPQQPERIFMVGEGEIKRECMIGGKPCVAVLDTGASINTITRKAVEGMRGSRIHINKSVQTVGADLKIQEAIETDIQMGPIQTGIILHIVDDAPAEVLLGTPFLEKHSRGYEIMQQEFSKPDEPDQVQAISDTSGADTNALEKVLEEFPKLVLGDDEQPDPTRHYKGQKFELGIPDEERDKVFFKAQYPPNPQQIQIYRKILEPLMKAGVYVVSDSPHNNPVMLVPKKTPGQFRLVVDNRRVNAVCRAVGSMSASPLSVIKAMSGAKIFTTLDCKNAFYSLELTEKDRQFTAISPPGMPHLELTRMPMGAKASMAALYQAMTKTLGDALYKYVLVWADDIIIFSKSMEEHIEHLRDVLEKLDRNGFCIARSKIELGKSEVKWLGYRISAEGVRPDDDKVEQLLSMRMPSSIKELRSALGMWTYFASFIPGYSIIAAPLMAQLRKDNTELTWNRECRRAWDKIKRRLASAPIMSYADYSQPLYLHTDACKNGFAAILTQEREGKHVLVDAISRTTSAPEKNYSSAKLECACVIWAAKRWKHYLYAVPCTIIVTDSYGLQYLQQKGNESALVQRWLCEMEGFHYRVMYRKGMENIADFLSRQGDVVSMVSTRSAGEDVELDMEAVDRLLSRKRRSPSVEAQSSQGRPAKKARRDRDDSAVCVSGEDWLSDAARELAAEQAADSRIQRLWDIAVGKELEQEPSYQEVQDAANVIKKDGIIFMCVKRKSGEVQERIIVPEASQEKVVKMVHEASHPGVGGTLAALTQYYWFRSMKAAVRYVVRHCPQCIARKGRPLTREEMAPDVRPSRLGGRWHVDGLQLPPSKGYDHLMVAVDAATKYVILRPSRGETAEAASGILMDITRRFGRPTEVTTDRGRAFMSNLFMKACEGLFIRYKPVGVSQPQANGMVERVNRTLTHVASIICGGDGSQWAKHVGEIEYALNTRVSSVTGYSPYELVYGRLPPDPIYTDIVCREEERGEDEQVKELKKRIQVLQQLAHENQMAAAEVQRSFHDAHAKAHHFQVGDIVHLYKPSSVEKGVTTKLAYKWSGPFKIAKVHGPVTFSLEDMNGKPLPGTYHARHLYKP